jgi:hypothetical protein
MRARAPGVTAQWPPGQSGQLGYPRIRTPASGPNLSGACNRRRQVADCVSVPAPIPPSASRYGRHWFPSAGRARAWPQGPDRATSVVFNVGCHPGIARSATSGTQGNEASPWPWVPALALTGSAGMTADTGSATVLARSGRGGLACLTIRRAAPRSRVAGATAPSRRCAPGTGGTPGPRRAGADRPPRAPPGRRTGR